MKKIIFRNPREKLNFENLKGEKTLVILPSQSAINFYIRDMLRRGIDITKTDFETFDGIGKKNRRKRPDSVLKYIILSKILKDNFVDYKKTQATLNLKSSELGQKFGEWLIFIQSDERLDKNTIYNDLIMYTPKKNDEKEKIILAKKGEFKSEDSVFKMILSKYLVNCYD